MSRRTIGHLTSEDRVELRAIIHAATELIDVAAGRLSETPSQQLDEHPNSWWRNYDKWMEQHAGTIAYRLKKFLEPPDKPPRHD
jgi:hypothetical protein